MPYFSSLKNPLFIHRLLRISQLLFVCFIVNLMVTFFYKIHIDAVY